MQGLIKMPIGASSNILRECPTCQETIPKSLKPEDCPYCLADQNQTPRPDSIVIKKIFK